MIVWLAVDWPRVMLAVPLAFPIVIPLVGLTVPISIWPAVLVAVPTSSLSDPELLVLPVALPVRKLKSNELVEAEAVAAVPTNELVVSTLNNVAPLEFCTWNAVAVLLLDWKLTGAW